MSFIIGMRRRWHVQEKKNKMGDEKLLSYRDLRFFRIHKYVCNIHKYVWKWNKVKLFGIGRNTFLFLILEKQ